MEIEEELILNGLSEEQKKIVISDSRIIRVIAGPGTGKTETLTRRILYLILCKKIDPSHIVAFTFTEKAAENMRHRIYTKVRELTSESLPLGNMFIGTIHQYSLKLLKENFGFYNFNVLDENQEVAFVYRYAEKLKLEKNFEEVKSFIRSINVILNELIDENDIKEKSPEFAEQFFTYMNILNQFKFLTFGFMIYYAVKKLLEDKSKTPDIKHLLVDEYQDINKAQEKLILLIAEKSNLFIVGDPRQTIYQWRGSDETCFKMLKKHFPDTRDFELVLNRRSKKAIVDLANKFAEIFEEQYPQIKNMREGNRSPVYLLATQTPDEEVAYIVSAIKELKKTGLNYKDIGILFRSVRNYANPLLEKLKAEKIPFIIGGKVGLFRHDEIKVLKRFYTSIPDYENVRDTYLQSLINEWSDATSINIPKESTKRIRNWMANCIKGNFGSTIDALYSLLEILSLSELDPSQPENAVIFSNIARFSQMLTDFEIPNRIYRTISNWREFYKELNDFINSYAEAAYEVQTLEDALSNINAVQVFTVHQSKGLEWQAVFVPCLIQGAFPIRQNRMRVTWLLSKELFDSIRYEGTLEDEKKLFYVAITRARDLLCLSYFRKNRGKNQKRSDFLENISGLLKEIETPNQIDFKVVNAAKDIADEQTFELSVEELTNFKKCPYFHLFRDELKFPASISTQLGFGESLKHIIYKYAQTINNTIEQTSIEEMTQQTFHLPFSPPDESEQLREKAINTIKHFIDYPESKLDSIVEIEKEYELTISHETSAYVIKVKPDLVVMNTGNTYEIRDLRVSQEMFPPELAAFQLNASALALTQNSKSIEFTSIFYLAENYPKYHYKYKTREDVLKKTEEEIKSIIKQIKNKDYKPNPSSNKCRNCDYRKLCPSNIWEVANSSTIL